MMPQWVVRTLILIFILHLCSADRKAIGRCTRGRLTTSAPTNAQAIPGTGPSQ
jgi:hypothetical protein